MAKGEVSRTERGNATVQNAAKTFAKSENEKTRVSVCIRYSSGIYRRQNDQTREESDPGVYEGPVAYTARGVRVREGEFLRV